jgi:hypothetical protein
MRQPELFQNAVAQFQITRRADVARMGDVDVTIF